MTCKINADTSDGLKLISDTSGSIDLQSNGNTDVSFASNALNIKSGTTLTVDSGATIANSGTATGFGVVHQITSASDATLYAIGITNATSDHAGSIAYTITPTATAHKVIIQFTIPQVKINTDVGGLRMRLYRDIGGAGYAHVTALDGTATSQKQGALFGNYDVSGDGNRSSLAMSGTVIDSPNTTSEVSYKFFFGAGDGSNTIFVNRTKNDADNNFTHRTRTHCTLMEVTV